MKTLFLVLFVSLFSTLAQAWSATPVLRCTTQSQNAPFNKLEIVHVQRASQFFVFRIYPAGSNQFFENFTSAPTQHRKVISSNYQTYSSNDKIRFELMIHTESLESYILLESNKRPQYNTLQPRTDFKCEILVPRLITVSTRP